MPSRSASARKSAHALPLRRADQRSAVEIGQRRADLQRREARAQAFEHLLVAAALDKQAAARRAGLAGVLHDGVDQHRQRGVEIRVGKDDLRSLAAQLECDRTMPLGGFARDRGAGGRRAGERDVLDSRMRGQRGARLAPESGDDVERAFGKPDACRKLGEAQQRQAGVLGRLDHAGIAGGERGTDRTTEDLQRVVPGNDVAGDAVRLAPGQHRVALWIGNRLAMELVAGAAVELEVARAGRDVGACLLHRLAAVARLEQREFFARDRVSRAKAWPAGGPFPPARALPPNAIARVARGVHRPIDILRGAESDGGKRLAVGGVDHRQRGAGGRRHPLVGDEMLRRRGDRRKSVRRIHGLRSLSK